MPGKQRQKHLRWTPPGLYTPSEFDIPAHYPPLAPRDEVVFLLHTGAEIEHALLVQYLYAAYSLKSPKEVPEEHASKVRAWKRTLLEIAREEMGHLITVQNLLRLIGGPINLEREDYPFRSQLYPFQFRLERVSKSSLAKYVVAEMPYMPEPTDEMKDIILQAVDAGTMQVNQVGAIYARILQLFAVPTPDGEPCLGDDDFVGGIGSRQAGYSAWGGAASVLVPQVTNRDEALHAIAELAEQGEGLEDSVDRPSHYQRLLAMYRALPDAGEWEATYRVPADPNTGPGEGVDLGMNEGRISHPLSLKWAELFNLRYRLLLAYLAHFLQSDGPLIDQNADHTARGLLNKWTFDEMRHLSLIASRLARLPRLEGAGDLESADRAGAPFELPYTLNLPDREQDRWRTHLDVLQACKGLEASIVTTHPEDADDDLLADLLRYDTEAIAMSRAAMRGEDLPHGARAFKKVVQLLEDGVRGFRIGVHRNFWRGCTRDQFVAMSIFGHPLIAARADGTYDAAASTLIKALLGEPPFDAPPDSDTHDPSRYPRMPAEHPPLPPEAIAYIHRWIEAGCPDNDPPGQVGLPEA